MSVFYFCVNKKLYHKFCSSKQHTHLLPYSCCESGVWAWCSWILCSVVQDFNPSVRQAVFSSGGLNGKESASKPIQGFGRIHFLRVACWLGATLQYICSFGSAASVHCHVALSIGLLIASYLLIQGHQDTHLLQFM